MKTDDWTDDLRRLRRSPWSREEPLVIQAPTPSRSKRRPESSDSHPRRTRHER